MARKQADELSVGTVDRLRRLNAVQRRKLAGAEQAHAVADVGEVKSVKGVAVVASVAAKGLAIGSFGGARASIRATGSMMVGQYEPRMVGALPAHVVRTIRARTVFDDQTPPIGRSHRRFLTTYRCPTSTVNHAGGCVR